MVYVEARIKLHTKTQAARGLIDSQERYLCLYFKNRDCENMVTLPYVEEELIKGLLAQQSRDNYC
jgi:hypothetical protein